MKSVSPLRIVSLVPSQTELLYSLGLEDEVVGITKFCIHPNVWFKSKTRVGGTKTLNLELIKQLNPTLIIANKEENTQEQIDALRDVCTVYVSDIVSFQDALDMIDMVGQLTRRVEMAREIIEQLQYLSEQLRTPNELRRVLYLIWEKPIMAAGKQTFIDAMLTLAGWENALVESRYPELNETQITQLNPDLIFLSSEPFPFKSKHLKHYQSLVPQAKVELIDGEMFSWYGSRLLHSFQYIKQLHEKLAHS
ncbi:MAG: cobalamin-binding protein [Chitinophagaceae bacterium]|nr:cobalamin-binding protein [Chitinophagaceae bacterium]